MPSIPIGAVPDVDPSASMSDYLSLDNLTTVINNIHLDNVAAEITMAALQGLAISFIALNILKSYWEATKNKGQIFSIYDLGKNIAYIALILSFNHIVGLMDSVLMSISDSLDIDGSQQIYNVFEDKWMNEDQENSSLWGKVFNIFFWILALIKTLAWFVNILIAPVFFLERGMGLLIIKIFAPIVIALAALEPYRALAKKWFLTYIAIFLSGAAFLLANAFCDQFFSAMVSQYDLSTNFDSQTMIFIVVALAKLKLYKASIQFTYKLFSL